ncbi:MAG: AbrB/MazE/SpoVT family DNA-binding domain-containing protein [Rhodothermales bacterium]
MHKKVAIRRIGNATGMTIPKKLLQRHSLAAGDKVFIVETELGLLITPFDPDFAQAMELYEEGNRTYRNAMQKLAE